MPAACESARTTSVCDTPTRSSPVIIFSSTKRCSRSSGAHHSVTLRRCSSGAMSRSVRIRSSTHRASGRGDGVLDDRQLIEDERGGLRAVADHRIRFLEQPRGQVRVGQRPVVDRRVGHEPLQPATGEKEHRPGGISRRRLGEVARHRRDLGVGGGGGVYLVEESGEAEHGLANGWFAAVCLHLFVAGGAPPPPARAGPHPRAKTAPPAGCC